MISGQLDDLCILVAQKDDQLAFEKIFNHFYNRLFLFTKSILKSSESAEEVVSDVFVKLWQNRESLPAIKNLNYYLFVSAKHAAFDLLRKKNRILTINFDDLDVEFGHIVLNPEEIFISSELLARVNQAISALPPKCKLIFKLIKEDGLKYREVAEMLNLSLKTVETQMSLALSKIGSELLASSIFPDVNLSRFGDYRKKHGK